MRGVYATKLDVWKATIRFIPTCVGFMQSGLPRTGRNTVHPHVRGVYGIIVTSIRGLFGSSPRAWGLFCHNTGISRCTPVHPHVRGVYGNVHWPVLRHPGSSPRAWGLSCALMGRFRFHRFIPTCVGFILCSDFTANVSRGSSPRAWGLLKAKALLMIKLRFIPTCVGFMHCTFRQQPNWSVHPHVRGVYLSPRRQARCRDGSSPRAWGIWMAAW